VAFFLPRLRGAVVVVSTTEVVAGIVLAEPLLIVGGLLSAAFGLLMVVVASLAHRGDRRADAVFAVGAGVLAALSALMLPGVAPAAALLPLLAIVPLLPGRTRRRDVLLVVTALVTAAGILLLGYLPDPVPSLAQPFDTIFSSATLLGVAFLIALALGDLSRAVRESLRTTAIALQRQQAIFDGALEPMLLVDDARTFIDANQAASDLLGIPRQEILGRNVGDFYRTRGDRNRAWGRFVATGMGRQRVIIRRPDGQRRVVDAASRANVVPGQHLTVWHDVTDDVRNEQERRAVLTSLNKLHPRESAEATARVVAFELSRLPGIDVAGVMAIDDGDVHVLALVADVAFPLKDGSQLPPQRARYLLEKLADGPWGELWQERDEDGDYARAFAQSGIRGQAYAPIMVDGQMVGFIAVGTVDEPYARHLVEDVPAVAEFAAAAGVSLGPQLLARKRAAAERVDTAQIIARHAFRPVFQPIVSMATGATVGFEALTRFTDGRSPDQVFGTAKTTGLGLELERATLEAAMGDAEALPRDAWLSLNVSPALLTAGTNLRQLLRAPGRGLVLELSEQDRVDDYKAVRSALAGLGPGVRLAVDDAGAGQANLAHIVELRADFVKLDARLVQGIDTDVVRRALIVGLQHFAEQSGCTLIAEGIETDAELRTLRDMKVPFGQGYLLGKPAPAAMLVDAARDAGLRSCFRARPSRQRSSRAQGPARRHDLIAQSSGRREPP
jgi:PAS domain S-box-containing protein